MPEKPPSKRSSISKKDEAKKPKPTGRKSRVTRVQRLELRLTPAAKEWFMSDDEYSPADMVELLAKGEWTIVRARIDASQFE